MTFTAVFETAAELADALEQIALEGATVIWSGQEASGWFVAQYEA